MLKIVREDGSAIQIKSLMDQVFSLETPSGWQYHWSISEARRYAEARGELWNISLSEYQMTLERLREHYPDVDEDYALTTDLTEPLLFVPLGESIQLIDGYHRVAQALLTNVDILSAYLLTQEEADASLVCSLPPGKGVDWGQPKTTRGIP
jgi:hypothetical protein